MALAASSPARAGAEAAPSPARAGAEAAPIAGLADRVAAVWPARQGGNGLFADPLTGRPVRGYGAIMLGYGLLSAGVRCQGSAADRGMTLCGFAREGRINVYAGAERVR